MAVKLDDLAQSRFYYLRTCKTVRGKWTNGRHFKVDLKLMKAVLISFNQVQRLLYPYMHQKISKNIENNPHMAILSRLSKQGIERIILTKRMA